MSHRTSVPPYTNEELALALSRLTYDSLGQVLGALSIQLKGDAEMDYQRGRSRLFGNLHVAALELEKCQSHLDKAWAICAPRTVVTRTEEDGGPVLNVEIKRQRAMTKHLEEVARGRIFDIIRGCEGTYENGHNGNEERYCIGVVLGEDVVSIDGVDKDKLTDDLKRRLVDTIREMGWSNVCVHARSYYNDGAFWTSFP